MKNLFALIFPKLLEITQHTALFIASYTPKSNEMIGRVNQTLTDGLRCKFYENSTMSWTTLANSCIDEYNNSCHGSTGFSSRFLLTGISNFENSLDECPSLNDAGNAAYESAIKAHERNKSLYDSKHRFHHFKEGDQVLIDSHSSGKLEPRRLGPFQIIQKLSENSFRLNIPQNVRKNNLVNAEQMHPYHKPDDQKIVQTC